MSLKEVFNSTQNHRRDVHVALNVKEVTKEHREWLDEIGFNITSIVGNKLTGDIESTKLEDLKKDPVVSEVELVVNLSPH